MTSKADKRGRIYLPKEIREKHGRKFRIVELPSHVALFPVADDPLAAIEAEVGDALADKDLDELKVEAREKAAREVADERNSNDRA
ncbi:AbrB/MazE/SpoVT family DNA-binding domain-containing protein [Halobellus marinus]|jgi:bifunctional DNA-binding transcriptional regulator/antitoxin component of YhaV-PrlF toxin-antitoxin module|uniref:AbrB/MazE/SpoVT family DNA-binding domain-containing protein n=1 Tax=Halobellus TaxID=1073986 RepID=UPI0028AD86B5|nr:AbrB/MazE/SpoVT family DNA-binding domain-containing protein [Halobellus sp. DFY28]